MTAEQRQANHRANKVLRRDNPIRRVDATPRP
jgi:hypothetical protein